MIEQLRVREAISTLDQAENTVVKTFLLEKKPVERWPPAFGKPKACPSCYLRQLALGACLVAMAQVREAITGGYDEELMNDPP